MQGSCLHSLQQTDRGHKLVWVADKIVQVAKGHVTPSMQLSQMPVVQMLEKNLLLELGDDMKLLPQYLAAAEQLQLRRLRQGLLMKAGTPEGWRQLQSTGQLSRHGYMIA
eukprot:jgi/Chrzof1/4451/Cz14g13190.t1